MAGEGNPAPELNHGLVAPPLSTRRKKKKNKKDCCEREREIMGCFGIGPSYFSEWLFIFVG